MPVYRSIPFIADRNKLMVRVPWRFTGMQDGGFSKPIIAIANSYSFTQSVPGHIHLKDLMNPGDRIRKGSAALRTNALLATHADKGAVRDLCRFMD